MAHFPVHPDCPRCNAKMNRKSGKYGEFWGCSRYPDCRGVLNSDGTMPGRECKDSCGCENEDDPAYDTVGYDGIYRIQDFGIDPMDFGDR